jgi:hypothetical protein
VADELNERWAIRQPVLCAEGLGPHSGDLLLQYELSAGRGAHPRPAGFEALYTSFPGVAAVALEIHSAAVDGTAPAGAAAPAANAPALLANDPALRQPPVGLLTCVWRNDNGASFKLHNNRVHLFEAAGVNANDDARPGRWVMPQLPPGGVAGAQLAMLGRQADGSVMARQGNRLLILTGGAAGIQPRPLGVMSEHASVRVAQDRSLWSVHEGQVHVLAQGSQELHSSTLSLVRPNEWAEGTRVTETAAQDLLVVGSAAQAQLVVVDVKGRLYTADASINDGACEAMAVTSPPGMGSADDWAVKSLGLSEDNAAWALMQNRAGHMVALRRAAGEPGFAAKFLADQPLLLVSTRGLYSPQMHNMQSIVHYDGHAQFGVHEQAIYYRSSPEHPWAALQTPDGRAMTGITAVQAGPFGFVDRKPVYVLRQSQPGEQQVLALKLEGRTTFLPATPGQARLPGGPLAVAPERVTMVGSEDLLGWEPGPRPRVDAFAVDKDKTLFALADNGMVYERRQATATMPAQPPRPINGADATNAPEHIRGLALAGDNRLYALAVPPDGPPTLHRLQQLPVAADDAAPPGWEALPLATLPPGPTPEAPWIRTSRTGTVELRMTTAQPAGAHAVNIEPQWHALLPGMTQADGNTAPASIDPQPSERERRSAINSGTNLSVVAQGASRLRTQNHDVAMMTTVLGNTSTDQLSWRGPGRTLIATMGDHLARVARGVVMPPVNAVRLAANMAGLPVQPPDQFTRLTPLFSEAQEAHHALAAALHAGFGQAPAQGATVRAGLQADRVKELEEVLVCLHKIGIISRAMDPTTAPHEVNYSGNTFSYRRAEQFRRAWSAGQAMVDSVLGREPGGLTMPLRNAFDQMLARGDQELSGPERALAQRIHNTLGVLSDKGVTIRPAASPDQGVKRDKSDPVAVHAAGVARALSSFCALEQANGIEQGQQAAAHSRNTGLGRLARAGVSNWDQVEAFDDVVQTFREEMNKPGSVRRTQMLKSLGLPPEASAAQAANRMAGLLQDLYNRTTFFSTTSDGATLSSPMSRGRAWKPWSVTLSGGFEFLHALGVERIGDSKDGDAGLVAFFVRHRKLKGSGEAVAGIDLKPGPGAGDFKYPASSADRTVKATYGGAGTASKLEFTGQHGMGAAILFHPWQIPEFARLLFDVHARDTTTVLSSGYNGGAIGLDLFESSASLAFGAGLSSGAVAVEVPYGRLLGPQPSAAAQSSDDERRSAAGGPSAASSSAEGALPPGYGRDGNYGGYAGPSDRQRPGGYGGYGGVVAPVNRAASSVTGSAPRASAMSYGLTGQVRANLTLKLQEMELHLNHMWSKEIATIFGLENQGQFAAVLDATASIRAGGSLGHALGGPDADPLRMSTGFGGLPLLGFNFKNADGLQGSIVTGSYKRTLDAQIAQSVKPDEWQALAKKLDEAFQTQLVAGEYPEDGGARINRLNALLAEACALSPDGTLELTPRTPKIGADAVDLLRRFSGQERAAKVDAATVIPGARMEINLLGRQTLSDVPSTVLAHFGLRGVIGQLETAKQTVPGLAQALEALKNIRDTSQVRYAFEMVPDRMAEINDGLRAQFEALTGGQLAPEAAAEGWHSVVRRAVTQPNLYRLQAIAVHNTDDNPNSVSASSLGFTHTRSAGTAKQLFQGELQFQYGPDGSICGVELLESARRALAIDFLDLEANDVAPIKLAVTQPSGQHFGPLTPRPFHDAESNFSSEFDDAESTVSDDYADAVGDPLSESDQNMNSP